jgi:hypothetical protein
MGHGGAPQDSRVPEESKTLVNVFGQVQLLSKAEPSQRWTEDGTGQLVSGITAHIAMSDESRISCCSAEHGPTQPRKPKTVDAASMKPKFAVAPSAHAHAGSDELVGWPDGSYVGGGATAELPSGHDGGCTHAVSDCMPFDATKTGTKPAEHAHDDAPSADAAGEYVPSDIEVTS